MAGARRVLIITAGCLIVLGLILGGGYRLMNSRTIQVAGRIVDRVETADRVVALTFDDGPGSAAETDAVLDSLAARSVPATFYVNGRDVEAHPDQAARIVAAGHELGNHTWSHVRMIFRSPAEIAREVESTDRVIRAAGHDGEITFRPPYGKKLLALPRYLADHDRTTVMWDVEPDSADGGQGRTADRLAAAAVAATRPGSIILLHPWHGRTATREAIGPIVEALTAQGYRFVPVSELIAGRGP